jgi:hypothetical protein
MRNKLLALIALVFALVSQPAFAATERMPCQSSESRVTPARVYLWIACPSEGRLMPEGMEVHFQGDKRDFVVRSLKLVPLDGPLGGTSGVADPRVPALEAKLAKVKADLAAIFAGL